MGEKIDQDINVNKVDPTVETSGLSVNRENLSEIEQKIDSIIFSIIKL